MSTINLWPSTAPDVVVGSIVKVLKGHRLTWANTVDLATCACGWQHETPVCERERKRLHRRHLAEVIAGLAVAA